MSFSSTTWSTSKAIRLPVASLRSVGQRGSKIAYNADYRPNRGASSGDKRLAASELVVEGNTPFSPRKNFSKAKIFLKKKKGW